MKKLAILLVMLIVSVPVMALEKSADWKDCNLPEHKETCVAEWEAKQAERAAKQAQLTGNELNKAICEDRNRAPCGGGAGGAGM